MKNYYWTTLLLSLALLIVSVMYAIDANSAKDKTDEESTAGNEALECIMTRASVRSYSGKVIPDSLVTTILKAGMAAPTAGDRRPWKFFVAKDPHLKYELSQSAEYCRMAATASVVIIVCGDTTNTFPGEGQEYWVQDTSAASENMLLAAHSLGIGGVWCGVYPISERVEKVKKILNMPSNYVPMSMLCFGYPTSKPTVKDKWNPENIFYGKYK